MTPVIFAFLAAGGVGIVIWALLPAAPATVSNDAVLPDGVMPSEATGAARRSFQLREALAIPIQGLAAPLMRGRQNQLQAELQRADLPMRAAEVVLIQVGAGELLVTAILIHRTVGGNLAEVLDQIADTIRERIKVAGEVRVLTAQARASGYIVTALPFAVGLVLSIISPNFEQPLFTNPLGWAL